MFMLDTSTTLMLITLAGQTDRKPSQWTGSRGKP